MKNKNLTLFTISILSLIFLILSISKNFFYVFSFFVIFLTSIYGFSSNQKIWYHKSAHIIVSSLIGIFLMAYEILNILFSLISGEFLNIKPNFYVIIFGVFSTLIVYFELRDLNKRHKQEVQ